MLRSDELPIPLKAPLRVKGSILRADLLALADLVKPGERVLDLGCGDGSLLSYLMNERQVLGRGVELSQEGALACVRKGISVRQGDLQQGLADFPDRSFDVVILSYTLPYLDDPAFILGEMLRVGRRALVSFPNWAYWRYRMSFFLKGTIPTPKDLAPVGKKVIRVCPVTLTSFREFCRNQGIRPRREVCLVGRSPLLGHWGETWRATAVVFELQIPG